MSWLSPGRVVSPCLRPSHASPALCHDTIHCIVTQMGSSPFPVSFLHIFFSHLFFFSFQLLENHPKKIICFSFTSKPNKFIKIYFIHFFSSFTHCKTLEKKKISSHHLFFSLNSGLFAQNFSNTCSHTKPSFQHFIFSYVLFTKHTNHTTHKTVLVVF